MTHRQILKNIKKKLDIEKKTNPKKYKKDEMKLKRILA